MVRNILIFISFLSSIQLNAQTTIIDSVFFNGVYRNYRLFLPANFTPSQNRPLVFNFHGYGSNAFEQEVYSGFDDVADTANVVVCYPNGVNNAWYIVDENSYDISFVDTLITLLHDEYNINLNRVYSTGMSNGGFLSNLLGCQLAHRFAAIAPVAGGNINLIQNSCSPSRYIPVLYIHGTADGVVNYNGSSGYVSADDLMELWSNANNCSMQTDTVDLPNLSTTDNCTVEKISWRSCDSAKHVIHYRIVDGGHTWPGTPFIIGVTNQDIVASKVIWEFFNQFALNTGVEELTDDNRILVYPNPFGSFIEITSFNPSPGIIEIFSSDGRLVYKSVANGLVTRLENLAFKPGIYFLRVSQNKNTRVSRIVKF